MPIESVRAGFRLAMLACVGSAALGVVLSWAPAPARPSSSAPVAAPVAPFVGAAPARRAHGYGWPLEPFDAVHPVRSGFGDPRFGARQRNFHFGIDIPAAARAPVYAVAPGTVFLQPDRVAVLVRRAEGPSGFAYWHVLPAVKEHVFVRTHQLIGWVNPAWGHLHFAELDDGRWVNPLRPGALTPEPAPFVPEIARVVAAASHGHATIVVDAFAIPPEPPPPPWQHAIVSPSLIRWRLLRGAAPVTRWLTAVDFRGVLPPNRLFARIYAPGTRPTLAGRPGRYLYYLAHDWDVRALPAGRYTVAVAVLGTRGARAGASASLDIVRTNNAP